jgi:hypothetical protein
MRTTRGRAMLAVLEPGKGFRGPGKRFFADVSVAMAHRGAFMAHQRHHDGIRNARILEQRNCRVAQTVEAQLGSPCVCLPYPKIDPGDC